MAADRPLGALLVSEPAFTILLPIIRPPILLPFAIASVQEQNRQDFELFVICDGAPAETRAYAEDCAALDPRIRVFAHPKGRRNGELYRDQALRSARGRFVCQIADDDLWFPNHLDEIGTLLEDFEFGNLMQTTVWGNGGMQCLYGDLSRPGVRKNMLTRAVNFFGPTAAGYRLETYRRLPGGWSPAPDDVWSDLYMWRKFLSLPGITCATRFVVTSLQVSADQRRGATAEARVAENRRLLDDIRDPKRRDTIVQNIMRHMMLRAQLTDRTLQQMAKAGLVPPLDDIAHRDDALLEVELTRLNRLLTRGSPIRVLRRFFRRLTGG